MMTTTETSSVRGYHTKLFGLSILSDVCVYGSEADVLNMRLVCKEFNGYLTEDVGMKPFWYTQIRRMAHRVIDLYEWSDKIYVHECYPDISKQVQALSFTKLDDVRKRFGECRDEKHLRYKIQIPDPLYGFKSRNLYEEWKTVAWKRMKFKYWNHFEARRVEKYEEEIVRLKAELDRLYQRKLKHEEMEAKYGVKKQQRKNKK